MRSLRFVSLCSTSVEMTDKEVPLLDSLPLIIKQLTINIKIIKKIHVKIFSKSIPLTRHLDRNEA